MDAVVGQDGRRHRFQEAHLAHAAVAAPPAPGAARAGADGVAFQPHREAELEDFWIRQARIGHIGLDHAGAVEARPRPRAAADGFVILVLGVTEREIVHRALGRRHHAQRAIQGVGDAGRRLHIARHDRGWIVRIEHGARRDQHLERLEAARVEGNLVIDQRAEHVQHGRHADGGRRVEVVVQLRRGAAEVDLGAAAGLVDPHGHLDPCAVVEFHRVAAVVQRADYAPHGFLGVVLHVAHVSLHHVEPEMRHHLAQLVHALLVGRHLGSQVGHVLVRIAGRPGGASQQGPRFRIAQLAAGGAVHQLEVIDQDALLLDAARIGRHRTRRGAADVGMVAARADVEQYPFARLVEHGRDHRHIRQMGAAVVRIVEHVDIARVHAARVGLHHGLDALAHGAQVHRHMGRVGDQVAFGVEDGAAKVQPFLDVDGVGRVLQPQPHLLGDRHEQVVEDLQHDRIGRGADGAALGQRLHPRQHQVVLRRDLGLPARLHHRGGVGFSDDGRALDDVADARGRALIELGVAPLPAAVHLHHGLRRQAGNAARRRRDHFRRSLRAAHGLHRHCLHDQGLGRHEEGEALPVGRLELGLHAGRRIEQDDEGGVRAFVTQVDAAQQRDAFAGHALALQFRARLLPQRVQARLQRRLGLGQQLFFHCRLAHHALVGQAHAVGRHDASQRVDEDRLHAQCIGHQAGVLAAGTAETGQRVFSHIVAALDGDLLDGVGHVTDRDFDESFGHLFGGGGFAGGRLDTFGHLGEL